MAALGRLEPAGDIRILAAPVTPIGASPRIDALLVQEGEMVRAGQLLARFDSAPRQLAVRALVRTRIANLRRRLNIQTRELIRYRRLALAGAIPADQLDRLEQETLELQGQLQESLAQEIQEETEIVQTELRAPIDGIVLRVHAREGERPGEAGILELGNTDRMEAVVEVYESDVNRVRVGQPVQLTSENGGFQGTLAGRVARISPQVRQREVLSTDPVEDSDARIVEVRVRLEPGDASRVARLAGMKVIARFQP
ncbi:HlyD family efflux transporter periplasmic adaptor subunit [Synechococcus sp. GFB01]|uniref:HlyD family efflux transporter periplasmic adaptor subunit n=1 Tax=Synechococcus sp. GFB01 TaxID=1662190 RepID=UPI000A888F4C|nr:HlyD family efflux transporter periplasmic adaptor subunit [Synechococcus sp. GFB01]